MLVQLAVGTVQVQVQGEEEEEGCCGPLRSGRCSALLP